MAPLTRRSCFISLAVIITVAFLLVIIVALLPPKCELTEEKPVTDLEKVNLLRDHSVNGLARIAGHLKYKTDNKTENVYLPLEFNEIYVDVKRKDNKKLYAVSLRSECAKILVIYFHSDTTTSIEKFFVTLEHPNGQHKTCGIKNPKGVWFPSGSHYKCAETKQYDCYANDQPESSKATPTLVATLVLDFLEFEVGIDEKNYDEDNFGTPATPVCPS